MIGYNIERDENGDDVLVLDESKRDWPLPRTYYIREAQFTLANLLRGHDRRDLAISRNTLHEGVQKYRALYDWGVAHRRDPRRFSSTPRPQ